MLPIIYTTYGVAMGHRPEALAESGGLRPGALVCKDVGAVRARVASAGRWLGTLLARGPVQHQAATRQTADADGMFAAAATRE